MVDTLWSFLGLPSGRDENSTWLAHVAVIAQLIVAGLIFRIWLGPFILERISHRVQVRRVSLRSIRGLYVRTSTASIRIDRVGLSYHPSAQASRRFGLKVEGVHIEVHEIKTKGRPSAHARRHRRFTRIPSLAELEPTTVAGNILSSTYKLLDSAIRPVLRTFSVSLARLVIQCLPALTQVVDFELDRAVVTFRADPEAHVVVKGMVLSTTVSFTKVESLVPPTNEPSRRRILAHVSTLRSRVSDSARRILGRAWGDTQGSAALCLTIEDVAGFVEESRLPSVKDRDGAWGYDRLTTSTKAFPRPFNLPGCTELGISFRFGPTKQLIEDRSVCINLKLPPLSFDTCSLEQFIDSVRSLTTKATCVEHVIDHPELSGSPFRQFGNKHIKLDSRFKLLRFFDLTVKSLSISHTLPASNVSSAIALLGRIHGLSASVELGEPRTRNTLHQEHLSKHFADEEDDFGTTLSASFSTRGMSIQRRESDCPSSLLRIVSIGNVSIACLTFNWLPFVPRKRLFTGDANAAFIAIKLAVVAPQLSEDFNTLIDILDRMTSKRSSEITEERRSPILRNVPQVHLEVEVEDIAACIKPDGQSGGNTSSLILCSTQFALKLSTYFRSYCPAKSSLLPEFCSPMDMLVSFRCVLGPAFVMAISSPLPLDDRAQLPSNSGSQRSGDPLLSLTAIEVDGSSQILAGLLSDEELAMLDVASAMTDLTCVAEALSVELWQPSSVLLLQRLVRSLGSSESQLKQPRNSVFDAIPRGISAHLAISEFALILTGKDINPDEDLDLSRGIGLKSGVAIQLCTLDRREQYKRLPKRFPQARDRSRLLLFEGLTTEAIAVSTSLKHVPKKLVLLRSSFWNVSVRTAVATEYAADHSYDSEDVKEIAELEFLWIKRLEGNFIYSNLDSRDTDDGQKRLQVSFKIPYIRSHFQLLNAYCVLLSVQTVKSLIGDRSNHRSPPKSFTSPSSVSLSIRVSIHTVQVMLNLPLGESICVRLNNMNARHTEPGLFHADFGTFFVWVPTAREDRKWEELLRLRLWKSTIKGTALSSLRIDIVCDGARLRIPHKYILADLILGLNVFLKSSKHLWKMTSEGQCSSIGPPPVEDAKRVPSVAINVGCISLEAADDPFESTLGIIHKIGPDAARARTERDEAFEEKVDAIMAAGGEVDGDESKRFSPQHTVSIEEAQERLLLVHSMAWCATFRDAKEQQKNAEEGIKKKIHGSYFHYSGLDVPPMVSLAPQDHSPPLLRIIASHFIVNISGPRFGDDHLVDFLYDLGAGIPRDTQYSLLIPLHLNFAIGASCIMLRDYPLPALNIVQESSDSKTAWVVDGDFVIAEELGSTSSVVWKKCLVVPSNSGVSGSAELSISVPKTTMPVKTYTSLTVNVVTNQLTEFCWAVSYAPTLQDVMRVLDTLSTPPPDPSPVLGFWDKLRLVLHWRVMINFASEIRLNLKGSRNPYEIEGEGAGFSFCWDGGTCMTVGHENEDRELFQVRSERLFVVIPKFGKAKSEVTSGGIVPRSTHGPISLNSGMEGQRNEFAKICAKLNTGIKWGIGFVLERTCGSECSVCLNGGACRVFDFRPHYDVALTPKAQIPVENSANDSFTGFRSSFIHMSTSLSSTPITGQKHVQNLFHLSPKTFTHFWSWWGLFDRSLSLPVRQGNVFSMARPPSKKFGQHLATLKYRFSVENLFISHVYKDESRRSWAEGLTHCVGVKALVRHFEADMHQREQEITVLGKEPGSVKKVHHKRFYAVEVKLIDLRLRAILAVFNEPSKHLVDFGEELEENRYQGIKLEDGENESRSIWFDIDDFVETDWIPPEPDPAMHITSIASCPRFTYFKRPGSSNVNGLEESRFGSEDTHVCLMGKEPSVHQNQSGIVVHRISELERELDNLRQVSEKDRGNADKWTSRISDIERKLRQLDRHARQLQEAHEPRSVSEMHDEFATYLMPSDIVCPADWTDFDNVYQAHCPKLCLSNSSRTILTQYYYCSRSRRGLEYHLATRAVKFIRDQADAHIRTSSESLESQKKSRKATGMAAQAIKKILTGGDHEDNSNPSYDDHGATGSEFDPMSGWSKEDVSLNKGHFCLLLKPQLILRSDATKDSILVLACTQASLQSYTISDRTNIDDPVTGKIMTRNAAELSGFQTFTPSPSCTSRYDGVPLEVLIDLRAESRDFDRLVPQTDATFRYDKFNRLRLRNNITSMAPHSEDHPDSHLQHQMDLIDISMPRFSVSADSKGFDSIANIITNLLLQSDSIHKERLSKIETLLFSYDFTDLYAASVVVEDLQARVRGAMNQKRLMESILEEGDEQGHLELLRMDAHIFLLAEELNLIFNAIQLAQQKQDDRSDDTKLGLKVRASSREISWGMVDKKTEIIAKLALRGIDYTWINRQDGSIVNNLLLKDIQVFDGSPDAEWPEILTKYQEPSNHPLVKRGIFVLADWTVLAPVGGIAIYERFVVDLHPMRLQLESKVGKKIMQYVWPARRNGTIANTTNANVELADSPASVAQSSLSTDNGRGSLDSHPAVKYGNRISSDEQRRPNLGLPPRRLTSSRSFNDLRSTSRQQSGLLMTPGAEKSEFFLTRNDARPAEMRRNSSNVLEFTTKRRSRDDAIEMKTRSAQKTFVLVQVSSMHILLSFNKDGSFFCRDARIQTRELKYRNQTWSFEELADQFIPSDTSWRGWMRMALHQPLIPVLPVAKELFSKTKWIASKGKHAKEMKRIPSAGYEDENSRTSEDRRKTSAESSVSSRKLKKARKSGETSNLPLIR